MAATAEYPTCGAYKLYLPVGLMSAFGVMLLSILVLVGLCTSNSFSKIFIALVLFFTESGLERHSPEFR